MNLPDKVPVSSSQRPWFHSLLTVGLLLAPLGLLGWIFIQKMVQTPAMKSSPSGQTGGANSLSRQLISMSQEERERFFKQSVCEEGRKYNASSRSYLSAVEQSFRASLEAKGEKYDTEKWQRSITNFRAGIAKNCPEVW